MVKAVVLWERAPDAEWYSSAEMGAAVQDGQTQGIPFHVYFVELG